MWKGGLPNSRVSFFPSKCGLKSGEKAEVVLSCSLALTAFGKLHFQRGRNVEIILSQ